MHQFFSMYDKMTLRPLYLPVKIHFIVLCSTRKVNESYHLKLGIKRPPKKNN